MAGPSPVILGGDPMGKKSLAIIVLLMILGVGILIYPAVSSAVNRRNGSFAIRQWQEQLAGLEDEAFQRHRELAKKYNDSLHAGEEPEGYRQILDLGNGMMGYIRIPSIHVDLPIYHGVEEDVLNKGVGHLPQSSLPIGRAGDHAVLTGHTGLPSARLFTDLVKLKEGDLFFIRVLDEELCYCVDQIRVVLPEEGEDLLPVSGEDYCTLVTCTPYGINSHRLLVRGRRTPLPESPVLPELQNIPIPQPKPWWLLALLPIPPAVCLLIKRFLDGKRKPAYNGKYLRREKGR